MGYATDIGIVRFSTNRSHLDLFGAISNVAVSYKLTELCPVEVYDIFMILTYFYIKSSRVILVIVIDSLVVSNEIS